MIHQFVFTGLAYLACVSMPIIGLIWCLKSIEQDKRKGKHRVVIKVEVPWEKRKLFEEHAKNFPRTKVV